MNLLWKRKKIKLKKKKNEAMKKDVLQQNSNKCNLKRSQQNGL